MRRWRGSSPHMRGTLRGGELFAQRLGIIPAYAGNTCSWLSSPSIRRDHPRICGEHRRTVRSCVLLHGIIPAYAGNTMRGAMAMDGRMDHPRICGEHLLFVYGGFHCWGIIPAYAGNTRFSHCGDCRSRDHPRICGEHPHPAIGSRLREGSSPHMRGTHHART